MNCNLEELKKRMPDAIRDVDYFNHIVIHQNDEIIRLLKKIAGEVEEVKEEVIAPIELVEPIQEVEVKIEEKPKTKRTKKAKEV